MTGNADGDWAAPGSATPPPGWSADQPPRVYPQPPAPVPAAPPGWGAAPGWSAPPSAPAAGWASYAPPPAPRPGIVPLRPLSVGEILDGAFTAIRRYPRTILGLSAIVAAVQQLIALVVDLTTGGLAAPGPAGPSALGTVSGLTSALVAAVLSAVLIGMLTLVIGDAVIARSAPIRSVWTRLRPMFWRLLGASLLAALLPWLGLVALIVGGVLLWVALSFTTPALVLERLTVRQAIRRSWRLTMRSFWRVLGIRLLAWLLAGVLAGILALPGIIVAFVSSARSLDSGNATGLGVGPEIVIRLSSLLANALTLPFVAGVIALLYIDTRMRTEALDVTLARAAAENPPA